MADVIESDRHEDEDEQKLGEVDNYYRKIKTKRCDALLAVSFSLIKRLLFVLSSTYLHSLM